MSDFLVIVRFSEVVPSSPKNTKNARDIPKKSTCAGSSAGLIFSSPVAVHGRRRSAQIFDAQNFDFQVLKLARVGTETSDFHVLSTVR